jgi:hypothetical protein
VWVGTLTLFLVKDALEALNLPFTLSILIQEAGMVRSAYQE